MREGLFLFTGPDNYFLEQELQKWQSSFAEKYGKEQCLSFSTDTISLQNIQEALQGGGLFANKKLIICKGIPDDKMGSGKPAAAITKFFEGLLAEDSRTFSPDIILVFVSIDPDKRLKLYKLLSEKANIKSFPALSEGQIKTFLQQKLAGYYSENLADYLIQFVGSDLFRLDEEIDKITTYLKRTQKDTLSDTERDNLVYTPLQANAFGTLDALSSGNIKEVLTQIDTAAQTQTAWPEFIGMLYRGLKHMIQTVDLYNAGTKSAKDIAAKIGMHFFPIVKNLKYMDFLSSHQKNLVAIFHHLLELDKNIKSGRFPQEGFWSEIKNIFYKNLHI